MKKHNFWYVIFDTKHVDQKIYFDNYDLGRWWLFKIIWLGYDFRFIYFVGLNGMYKGLRRIQMRSLSNNSTLHLNRIQMEHLFQCVFSDPFSRDAAFVLQLITGTKFLAFIYFLRYMLTKLNSSNISFEKIVQKVFLIRW